MNMLLVTYKLDLEKVVSKQTGANNFNWINDKEVI